ncbi:MAG: hypothetical protein H7196_02995 [candidate division SR1 bacterium]|nr:hypothetical protein [candidate division SR1 bacterium]
MVTLEEIESLFTEFSIRVRHFSIIPELIKVMEKIPYHSFRDVITELAHLEKIPYSKVSKGSIEVLKYINTFPSETFLSNLIIAINQIAYKSSKSKEETLLV